MIRTFRASFAEPSGVALGRPRFQGDSGKRPPVSAALEWLETSGDGSYASSTVGGAHTRRYHGSLVASLSPPVDRHVLLSRIDEILVNPEGNGVDYPLSTSLFANQDPNSLENASPLLEGFSVYPIPTWSYRLPDNSGTLSKQLAMRTDQSTVVIGYTLSSEAKKPVELTLRPLVNRRGFHFLSQGTWPFTQEPQPKGLVVRSGGVEPLYFSWNSSPSTGSEIRYRSDGHWYHQYFYQREADRGLDRTENNYSPGELRVTLQPGATINLIVSAHPVQPETPGVQQIAEEKSRHFQKLLNQAGLPDTETNRLLIRAADQFIVRRQSVNGPTILAGYHWFNDWGRDTMIALPGLILSTRRFKEADGILNTFARYAKNGLLPNNFPDSTDSSPGYNTLDASMWWFHAVDFYRKAIKSTPKPDANPDATHRFLKGQYEKLREVVNYHLYGRHSGADLRQANPAMAGIIEPMQPRLIVGENRSANIGMDPDGLIAANNPQLTWMDAADGSWAFTPRSGKPVEVNVLWYNGLHVMAELAADCKAYEDQHNPDSLSKEELHQRQNRYEREIRQYKALARLVGESLQKYWNPQQNCLNDLLDSPYPWRDRQIRPNQLFALSLPHRAFSPKQERAILETVEKHLLTPYGLRSLSPTDPEYAPHYPNAGSKERDSVYHQGAVWSWLIGPYLDAWLNVNGRNPQTRQEALTKLQPLLEHLQGRIPPHIQSGSALGGIAEIFDGTAPHYAKGTVNQAWSVAELLRQLISLAGKSNSVNGQ